MLVKFPSEQEEKNKLMKIDEGDYLFLLDMERDISTKETDTTVMIEFTNHQKPSVNGLNALKPQDSQIKGLKARSPAQSFEDLLNECTEQSKEEAFKLF